jgi:D-tyrosyl-tRNA(Tyr) deacylase
MIAVIQRVASAQVEVDGSIVGRIDKGIVALVAVERDDTSTQVEWMAAKLAQLRIFPQGEKNFDLDVKQAGGSILLVSNFTVAAETRKGRRPSLDAAASPERGRELFELLVLATRAQGVIVETGQFQAHMHVSLVNDGPITMIVKTEP